MNKENNVVNVVDCVEVDNNVSETEKPSAFKGFVVTHVALVCLIWSIISTIVGGFPLTMLCMIAMMPDTASDFGYGLIWFIVWGIISLIPIIITGAYKNIFSITKKVLLWSWFLIPILPIDLAFSLAIGCSFFIIALSLPFVFMIPCVVKEFSAGKIPVAEEGDAV